MIKRYQRPRKHEDFGRHAASRRRCAEARGAGAIKHNVGNPPAKAMIPHARRFPRLRQRGQPYRSWLIPTRR